MRHDYVYILRTSCRLPRTRRMQTRLLQTERQDRNDTLRITQPVQANPGRASVMSRLLPAVAATITFSGS